MSKPWVILFLGVNPGSLRINIYNLFNTMRTKQVQEKLDNYTLAEKIEMTSPTALRSRWMVVKEFGKRMLCVNEYPNGDRLLPQYILRARDPRMKKSLYDYEFAEIIEYIETVLYEEWKEYRIMMHTWSERSIQYRSHRHIYPIDI